MLNITIRRKAKQFGQLVRTSAVTPRTGRSHKPHLVTERELGVTFIGHSSFLIQIAGRNIVVDPNFARWLFVLKRQRRPGIRLSDLPPIDYVLVSHAHFDHLHRPSLRAIARLTRWRCGRAPQIVVPRNVGDIVARLGFSRVHEVEWWQEFREGRLSVTHTPAQHWGARMLRDFHRGFGGYVVRSQQHSIYHAGDTAYFEGFREIGRRLRPELALLPIGAYHPEHFRNVHTSPEDALQGFLDLGSRAMIPMHYGTFRLSYEPMDEPVQRLRAAADAAGVSDRVLVLEEGKTRIFK
ncbi:MAG: MBL fold metallo-hydrolase [Acidobacteria bacterium]|nr:MAG: MBL fold metallo-hydrolase [Acidobacteriota bacterium]